MDYSIKKDKRSKGFYHHKNGGIKCKHTKRQACLDISEECGEGQFYVKNYIHSESWYIEFFRYDYNLRLEKQQIFI